jgi:hypothetical protein
VDDQPRLSISTCIKQNLAREKVFGKGISSHNTNSSPWETVSLITGRHGVEKQSSLKRLAGITD